MKFLINRASNWEGKPCEEAKQEKAKLYIDLTFKTVEKAKKSTWGSSKNRVLIQKEGFVRAIDKKPSLVWVVELNTLKELISFINKYDDIVLGKSTCESIPYRLIIYDDYLE